mmetsp:Transcript_58907/g.149248  ORF Transcript_58907/g.149248 Transcript_58907/m.149248 type:complete len:222 (-) Transcript_58907:2330-2995(-)
MRLRALLSQLVVDFPKLRRQILLGLALLLQGLRDHVDLPVGHLQLVLQIVVLLLDGLQQRLLVHHLGLDLFPDPCLPLVAGVPDERPEGRGDERRLVLLVDELGQQHGAILVDHLAVSQLLHPLLLRLLAVLDPSLQAIDDQDDIVPAAQDAERGGRHVAPSCDGQVMLSAELLQRDLELPPGLGGAGAHGGGAPSGHDDDLQHGVVATSKHPGVLQQPEL